ncbi:MAG TPA: flagellar hook-basal body protein [Solirubrobacteraceae bacterium]|nr:flagellar hook-basal body protein [Solirubrobacteraceae bacterium]
MLEGLYMAATGMEAQQEQLNALANDMANMSTPGYQATRVGFHDLLYTTGGKATGSTVATGAGAAAQIIGRSQLQGSIQRTDQPLDVAIVGEGYIQVRRPDGSIGLTRNGVLQTDAQGHLTTNVGMLLEPPITLPKGVRPDQVTIGPDGTVATGTHKLGKISLVTVPAPDQLLADGDGVFSATAASGAIRPATGVTLQQGAVEASNVDVADTMVGMIDAQTGYSMSSKAVNFEDQMLSIANQIKR